jgi:glycosyltransferase involved in cell wall biosynthesis
MAPRMRLLHVVPSYHPAVRYGGIIRSVHGLCAGLAALGDEVQVLTTNVDGPGESKVPVDRPVFRDGVTIRYFPVGPGRRLYRSPAMSRALSRLVPQADLVHAHAVYLWPTWASARAAEALGVPYLVAPRGMLVRELISRKSRIAKSLWIRLVERRSLARAAAIHVTSATEAAGIRELGLDLAPLIEVPNGVDLPPLPLAPAEPDAWRDAPVGRRLLYLGRINWKKGLDRLIPALAGLPDVVLVVAGNDEEGLTPDLRRLAEATGVHARVRFTGPVHGAAKWQLLHSADLLVLPSLSENFGIVVLEALGVGTPVVVSPGVGVADLVTRNDLGLVVPGDPEALARSIGPLLADPARRAAMGERGLRVVRAQYSWSAVARRMSEAYGAVLARHRAAANSPVRAQGPPSRTTHEAVVHADPADPTIERW